MTQLLSHQIVIVVIIIYLLIFIVHMACVCPGHCCYRIGPIRFLARWHKK